MNICVIDKIDYNYTDDICTIPLAFDTINREYDSNNMVYIDSCHEEFISMVEKAATKCGWKTNSYEKGQPIDIILAHEVNSQYLDIITNLKPKYYTFIY